MSMMYFFSVTRGREKAMAEKLRKQGFRVEVPERMYNVIRQGRESQTLIQGIVLIDLEEPKTAWEKEKQSGVREKYALYPVDDREMRRIGKMTDRTPSAATYDGKKIRFTSGPLMGIEPFVKVVDINCQNVLVAMKLLGENRDIWLAVDITRVEPAPEQKRILATGKSGIHEYTRSYKPEREKASRPGSV